MASNGHAVEEAMELEAMCEEDSSWHPCTVSLGSTGNLVVDFGTEDLNNVTLDKEESLKRLRVCSLPLQFDECSYIKEGDLVLGTNPSQPRRLFYDAVVEKILRVRHSKRVSCRCTFVIRWLNKDLDHGSLTVPSNSILRLAPKSVKEHQTVAAYLNSLKIRVLSPFSSVLEEADIETDPLGFLEKQIQDIRNSADASQKNIPEDFLLKVDVDSKGQLLCGQDGFWKVNYSSPEASHQKNYLKNSTHGADKLTSDMEVKQPAPAAVFTQNERLENRSPLSPFAACAALACRQTNLPRVEFLGWQEGEKEFTHAQNNSRHRELVTESLTDTKSACDNLSSEAAAAPPTVVAEPTYILEPLISTATVVSGQQHQVNAREGKIKKERETTHTAANLTNSASKKSRQSGSFGGLTDSAIAVNTVCVSAETKTSAGKLKLGSQTSLRRSARRVFIEEKKISTVKVLQELEVEINSACVEKTKRNKISSAAQATQETEGHVINEENKISNAKVLKELEVESQSTPVEKTKGQKFSSAAKVTREAEGKDSVTSHRSSQMRIPASSDKPRVRFSHRLNFLPRTRSQNRSKVQ